jgi:hypothetical protein
MDGRAYFARALSFENRMFMKLATSGLVTEVTHPNLSTDELIL